MQYKHGRIHWAAGAIIVLATMLSLAPAAQADTGRVSFAGAIVTPTCNLDAGSLQQANQAPSHVVQVKCASTRNNPLNTSAYQLQVGSLDGAAVDARVQTYFQQFSPESGTMVALQTYR